MNIAAMAPENRPRERLQHQGAEVLSNAELLAIILKSGTKKESVLELGNKLLSKYGLERLSSCSLPELMNEYGIGHAKACQMVALFELYRRMNNGVKKEKIIISSAKEIAELYQPRLNHLNQEHFLAVYLDAKNKIIADQTITIGILNASLIHPREVFYGAIKHLAHSVIVLHNHPSGDPAPSDEDLKITKILEKTGEIMGITLIDHVIIGKDSWWSWRER